MNEQAKLASPEDSSHDDCTTYQSANYSNLAASAPVLPWTRYLAALWAQNWHGGSVNYFVWLTEGHKVSSTNCGP